MRFGDATLIVLNLREKQVNQLSPSPLAVFVM